MAENRVVTSRGADHEKSERMTARSYLVLQALTLLKLSKAMRNPAAALKAAEMQARSECLPEAVVSDPPNDSKAK